MCKMVEGNGERLGTWVLVGLRAPAWIGPGQTVWQGHQEYRSPPVLIASKVRGEAGRWGRQAAREGSWAALGRPVGTATGPCSWGQAARRLQYV